MKRVYCKQTYAQIALIVEKAVEILGWSIDVENSHGKVYQLKAPANLLSFGNRIVVTISTTPKRGKSVTVESTSSAQLQIIDWGKNTSLEEMFVSKIKELSNHEVVRKK